MRVMTYSEQISEFIKQVLIKGDLEPGQRIKEVELANMLSISRAPVREALNLLVKDGLITYTPQKGKFVRNLTPKEIKEKYFMGGVLEAACVGEALENISDEDIENLEGIIVRMGKIDREKEGYSQENAELDHEFHNIITGKSNQKTCAEYGRKLCERMSKFLLVRFWANIYTQDEIVERHKAIVEALKTKNRWVVEEAVRNHYRDLGEKMSVFGMEATE